MRTIHPNFIVGIGGSAGGLSAYIALLDNLPCHTGMAFVIVSHIYPTADSHLTEILKRHTEMKVFVAAEAMPIRSNHVYVIPANADLRIVSYTFKVVIPRIKGNVQVDIFFTSLAESMKTRAIGVVLSGYFADGTEGCKNIKANGGTTFAQDNSAEINGMPLSAQASGFIDFVLPPDKISHELTKIAALAV